jgi:hypothetical protein
VHWVIVSPRRGSRGTDNGGGSEEKNAAEKQNEGNRVIRRRSPLTPFEDDAVGA